MGSSRSEPGGRTPARGPLLTLTLRLGPSWLCRPQALHFAVRCGMWQVARLQDWDLVGNGRDRPATASSALKANASSGSLGRGGHGWDSSQSSAPQPRRWTVYLSPPSTFALLATGPPAHPRSRNHFHLRVSGLSWPSQSEPMKHKAPETPPHSTDFPKCPELSCFSPGLPILLVPDSIVSCLETITDFWFPWSVAALQSVLHRATRGIPFKLHTLCSNPPVAFFPLRVLTGGL